MTSAELLQDAYGRISEIVHRTLAGIDPAVLAFRPDPDANSIAWLVWHLTRVQDDHISEVAGVEQRWAAAGWHGRSGLDIAPEETGYGHSSAAVARLAAIPLDVLVGYHDDVAAHTRTYVGSLRDADLDRIVDTSWDPPVTLGVRLVSVIADNLQHAGQAAYVRGLADRAR